MPKPSNKNKKTTLPVWLTEPYLGYIIDTFIVIFIYFYLVKMVNFANTTVFFTDECFYICVSEYIANFKYPIFLEGFYTEKGLTIATPPLMFIISGMLKKLSGDAIFKFYNILILFVTIGTVWQFLRKQTTSYISRTAIVFFLSSPLIFAEGLRFYVEHTTSLTFTLSLINLYLCLKYKKRHSVLLTAFCFTLFNLSKQTGILSYPILFIAFLIHLIRKDYKQLWPIVKIVLWTIFLTSPFYLHLYSLTGSPIPWIINTPLKYLELFPLVEEFKNAPDYWQRNRWRQLASVCKGYGVITLITTLGCMGWQAAQFKRSLFQQVSKYYSWLPIWTGVIFSFFIFCINPNIESRHFLQFLPIFAIFSTITISEQLQKFKFQKALHIILIIFLLFYDSLCLANYPNYRNFYNLPKQFQPAMQFLKEKTPQDSTILAIWCYEIFYHARRKVIQQFYDRKTPDDPWELYVNKDKDYFYSNIKKYGIDYIFIDKTRIIPIYMYNMHPKYIIDFINELINTGKARVVYDNPGVAIIEFL